MAQLLLAVIYLSFISLGLPDSLLGSAWPSMYPEFGVPVSYAGILSPIIAIGTVISSLQSDRLTRKLGTGGVTVLSVAMTAVALLGFSFSHSFGALCLWAIPYGLGAGSVDASLNNYVALHYASRHMSWLHCMWGIGASLGPYVMGMALAGGQSWNMGYRYISLLQAALTVILLFSLPLWKKRTPAVLAEPPLADGKQMEKREKALPLAQVLRLPGAKEVMGTFFCYCALESTAGFWASSYLVLQRGVSALDAARYASLFYLGITVGRALSGFLTMRFNDSKMVRLGEGILAFGVALLLLPLGNQITLVGLVLVGLGCAPIYPCLIHATPANFGAERSQAVLGVQMASAYVGTSLMPPLFGWLAHHVSPVVFPFYLLLFLALMTFLHEKLLHSGTEKMA